MVDYFFMQNPQANDTTPVPTYEPLVSPVALNPDDIVPDRTEFFKKQLAVRFLCCRVLSDCLTIPLVRGCRRIRSVMILSMTTNDWRIASSSHCDAKSVQRSRKCKRKDAKPRLAFRALQRRPIDPPPVTSPSLHRLAELLVHLVSPTLREEVELREV
jgi:hypothetical protein